MTLKVATTADPKEPASVVAPGTQGTRVIHGPDEVAEHLAEVTERLARAERILLTCHRKPDGDSMGTLVALASLFRARGKKATLYNPDPVPRRFKWLPLTKGFVRSLAARARFDVTVVVDCAHPRLLGKTFPGRDTTGEVIALDHHTTAVPFGDIYLCDPDAASVGVLVARMARHLGWDLTPEAAVGLYVSLVSDTGSFRYANTNAEALALAAELVARGVSPWQVSEQLYERVSPGHYRLLAAALDTLVIALDGKVALMAITRDMLKQAGATWDDSIDMVSYARAIDHVECGVLFTPMKGGGVRVSMRSKGRVIDAGMVCARFGGGGHRGAAGCVLGNDIDMDSARDLITRALAEALGMDGAPGAGAPTS